MSENARALDAIIRRVRKETEFDIINIEKLDRVVNGVLKGDGTMTGGVGEDASTEEILAAYDKAGGLIKRNGDTVRTGSFYNFRKKEAHKEPKIEFVFRVNGKEVFVPEGQELPGEVRAARILEAAAKKGSDEESTEDSEEVVAGEEEEKPKSRTRRAR